MRENPLISIIIPVYNTEQFLTQCLDSLIHQTLEQIQIICVNDGSTDGSRMILEYYAGIDSRIEIINQVNQGVSAARNHALPKVRGKYVMYLDSDDWIEHDTCKCVLEKAEEKKVDLVFWPYIREFKDCSLEKHIFDEQEIFFDQNGVKEKLYRRMFGPCCAELKTPENLDALVTVWGKLYRSSIILENDIQYVDLSIIGTEEDMLFNIYALKYVRTAIYVNRYFNHYRRDNGKSLTSNYKKNLYNQWLTLFEKVNSCIMNEKLDDSFREALNNRICLSIMGLGLNISSSEMTFWEKKKRIKDIISSRTYREAYKKLNLKYFPLHWKLFYGCAKYNCAVGVCLLLCFMKMSIGKK